MKHWESILARTKASPFWLNQVKSRGTVPSVMSPAETHEFARQQYTAYHSLSKYIGPNK